MTHTPGATLLSLLGTVVLLASLGLAACENPVAPTAGPGAAEPGHALVRPAAVPLTPVPVAGEVVRLWSYIGTSLDGTPSDPVNLIFTGVADPRNIRDALLALDGGRGGPFGSFACTWTDAIGGMQAAYAEPRGWSGTVIQLECGEFETFRFHLRLFPSGTHTLANAHVEIRVPGTPEHQVISWEVAEQFVVYEMARAGVLAAAPAPTAVITAAPTFRDIPAIIYNGLPASLRALAGGPAGDVTDPVGIQNDGRATILVVGREAPAAGGRSQTVDIPFAQVIPKPFCAAAGELVRVDGPLRLTQEVAVSPDGVLSSQTFAEGTLRIRTFDPSTGTLGPEMHAEIRDHYHTRIGDDGDLAQSARHQLLVPGGGSTEQLQAQLLIGSDSPPIARVSEICD